MRSNDLSRPRALHRRFPRVVSALCIGAVGLGVAGAANVAGAATPPNASATSMSSPTTLSGHEDLHSPSVGAVGGGVTASFDLLETLSWSQHDLREESDPTGSISRAQERGRRDGLRDDVRFVDAPQP